MKTTDASSAPSPADLLNDLRALVAEAEKLAASSGCEQSDQAACSLRSRLDNAQTRLSELYAGTRQRVIAGAKCTDEAIRANPYQSLAIAAGVGLLVGILVGRRER
jgi:ElaB/YqjD/DUF883 family membrane-anchored ribosome-binding protein